MQVPYYHTRAEWVVGHATAHIANPAWQRDPGAYEIVTVGETGAPVRTMGGMRITPDMALADLDPADSAMLVLPGAETWLHGGNAAFAAAAGEVLAAGGAVAAICGATVGLAAAGLLDDRWHTSNAPEALAATGYAGGHRYRHEPAVTGGRLITASGVEPVAFPHWPCSRSTILRAGRLVPALRRPRPRRLPRPRGRHAGLTPTGGTPARPGAAVGAAALTAFRLNGQFLGVAEQLARPVGLTAAWWQVLGAVLRSRCRSPRSPGSWV